MNFKPPRHVRDGIRAHPLTPMIDVVFLLLVYFLATFSFTPPEANLTPALRAERVEAGAGADFQPQVVEVGVFSGAPGFRLGSRVVRDQSELRGLLELLPREGGVFVKGRPQVQAYWALAAVQAARDAGFERVSYVPGE